MIVLSMSATSSLIGSLVYIPLISFWFKGQEQDEQEQEQEQEQEHEHEQGQGQGQGKRLIKL
jgi:hypothetical protein